ncbi:MAG TPA: ATP-binding protein [Terriglobales bacterium]|nr:ATP-binding protein [Terriglobales bacterium]
MVLITTGLTSLSLLLVRQSVQSQITREMFSDLRNSVSTFQSFQHEKEVTLSHSADLLADLPNLRALMTTHDEATIQDGSEPLWRLAGSELFVLADREGNVVALHTNTPGFTREMAQVSLTSALQQQQRWWFGARRLYEVFLKPIYSGPAAENHLLGFLVIGYEINQAVASQISRIADSKVVFYYGDTVVTGTLGPGLDTLAQQELPGAGSSQAKSVQLGDERFLESTVQLSPHATPNVQLTVLRSYDEATALLRKLNRLLLALGLLAVFLGSALVFIISDTFTRPLSKLLAGVSALEKGDFTYALNVNSRDEVGELSRAFDRMRESLLKSQQNLIESERLATIGRMASSISHDLRHSLAAIVANAEFLCESHLSREQKEELYQEVQSAVHRMTELIDSLLEFSRTSASLRPTYGDIRSAVDNAVRALRANPEFHNLNVVVRQSGTTEGWFDHRKLERVFFNLLLNACESMPDRVGQVEIELHDLGAVVEIRVSDNGRGIPESVRNTLFEPFVSFGKENGTGLGLTVVQKIIQDHGGDIVIERTSSQGTVFRITLPFPTPHVRDAGALEEAPSAGVRLSSAKQE